jgi:PAS domain S-box-containing protein
VQRLDRARLIIFFCASLTALIAAAALLSWILNLGFVATLAEKHVIISQDTSIALLLLATSLLLWLLGPRNRISTLACICLSAAVSLFGLLMFVNYFLTLSGSNFEKVFLTGSAEMLESMSPVTSASLLLFGAIASIVFIAKDLSRKLGNAVADIAALVGVAAVACLLASIYGAQDFYGNSVRPVAALTSVALALYAFALVAASGQEAWPNRTFSGSGLNARLLRIFLPVSITLLLFISWFTHYFRNRLNVSPDLASLLILLMFTVLTAAIVVVTVRMVSETVEQAQSERKRIEAALRESESRLRAVIDNAPEGIVVANRDAKLVLANPVARHLYARPVPFGESYESRANLNMLHLDGTPYDPRDLPLTRSALDGEHFIDAEFDIMWPSGELRHLQANSSPIRADNGDIIGAVGVFHDITERKEAEHELSRRAELSASLNRISTLISTTFNPAEIMQKVIEEGVKAIGTESAFVTRKEGDFWAIAYSHNLQMPLGYGFIDEGLPHAQIAAGSRQPVIVNDSSQDEQAGGVIASRYGIRSFMAVPFVVRGEVAGLIYFNYHSANIPFADAEIDFAVRLSTLASLVLENARLYRTQRQISETLQEALVVRPERCTAVRVGHIYRSATQQARVGGDFYDVFEIGAGRIGMMMGDAAGKGIPASALVSVTRNTIRAYALDGNEPETVCEKTNKVICKLTGDSDFVTFLFATLDIDSGLLVYCSAGHPPGIIKRKNGDISVLPSTSTVVGAFPDARFERGEESLAEDDVLLLYTDGVIEARKDSQLFGWQSVVQLVSESESDPGLMSKYIYEKISEFTGGRLSDDVAIMAIARAKAGDDVADTPDEDESPAERAPHQKN